MVSIEDALAPVTVHHPVSAASSLVVLLDNDTQREYSKGTVEAIEKTCRLRKNHGPLAMRVARQLDVKQQETVIAMSEKLAALSRAPARNANLI